MSHEVLITRRQRILSFLANPGRAGLRSTVVVSSFTTILLRSALPGYAKNNKILEFEFVTPTTITCRNEVIFPFLHVKECKYMEIYYLYV
jgi:hypothetical protein